MEYQIQNHGHKARVKNPERTRAILLEKAFEEIYEHGFQSASLERILAKTQVTKGALYHHFANKHELGIAVVKEVIADFVFKEHIADLEFTDDPISFMINKFDNFMEDGNVEMAKHGCPMNNLIQEMGPLDQEFRTQLAIIMERWRTALADALRRGQARAKVREDLDCDAAALFIVASMEGFSGIMKSYASPGLCTGFMTQIKSYIASLAP